MNRPAPLNLAFIYGQSRSNHRQFLALPSTPPTASFWRCYLRQIVAVPPPPVSGGLVFDLSLRSESTIKQAGKDTGKPRLGCASRRFTQRQEQQRNLQPYGRGQSK